MASSLSTATTAIHPGHRAGLWLQRMRVYSAHDGAMLDVAQPLRAFSSVSALADVVSLVTGIVADAVIIITDDGAQLTDDLLTQLVDPHAVLSQGTSPSLADPDLFIFSRDILSAEPELVGPSLQDSVVLEPPLPGTFTVPPSPPLLSGNRMQSNSDCQLVFSNIRCSTTDAKLIAGSATCRRTRSGDRHDPCRACAWLAQQYGRCTKGVSSCLA